MNKNGKIWACPNNDNHLFNEKPVDGLCPHCIDKPYFVYMARLKETDNDEGTRTDPNPPSLPPLPEPDSRLEEKFGRLVIDAEELYKDENYAAAKEKYSQALEIFNHRDDLREMIKKCDLALSDDFGRAVQSSVSEDGLGLCVLLMDASGSMFTQSAFEGSEENRAQVVARAAARGIMGMKEKKAASRAYLAIYKFDHRVKPVFIKSMEEVIQGFKSEKALEEYLYNSMESDMGGETDINGALQDAYNLVDSFLNRRIKSFRNVWGDRDYPVMIDRITNRNSFDFIEVPNVRVFIYTDGLQYVQGKTDVLLNPFLNGGGLPDTPADILLGAFIGSEKNDGCRELKAILSDCPEHDVSQFFLIKDEEDVVELTNVFHMATGNSGFCKECVEKWRMHTGQREIKSDLPLISDML